MANDFRTNPKFKARMLAYFDRANKDGLLKVSDAMQFVEKAKELTGKDDSDKDVQSLQGTLREFFRRCRVTTTGIDKNAWLGHLSNFLVEDLKQMKEEGGEKSLVNRMNGAWFDTFDKYNIGELSREDFAIIGRCLGYGDAWANTNWFDSADTNHNGKIERDEYIKMMYKFWFEF